jgi:hypothetical protein
MSGGGKGGSNTQATEIPKWLEEPAIRNIARAEDVQRIPYMPWYGPDVAAFNPDQQAAMQSNIGAAEAFGLVPTGKLNAMSGVPSPISEYTGGIQGYSANPLYNQALADLKTNQPGAVDQYDALFGPRVDPVTGNILPSYEKQVAQGNTSSYGNYGLGIGADVDLSSFVNSDGSIDWGRANNPQYGVVDGVGVENPNHPDTGYTGPSSSSGNSANYGGGGGDNYGYGGDSSGYGESGSGFGGHDDGTDASDAAAADQGYW